MNKTQKVYLKRLGFCALSWCYSIHILNASELINGRCYMDDCSYFSIDEMDIVGSNKFGALFSVNIKGWTSHHPNGSYDRRTKREGGKLSTLYVFCSKSKPAIIGRDGQGKWEATILPLNTSGGPPGAQEDNIAIYYAACHAGTVGKFKGYSRIADHFLYPKIDEVNDDIKIGEPEDILK